MLRNRPLALLLLPALLTMPLPARAASFFTPLEGMVWAYDASADGSVVVGQGSSSSGIGGYIWTEAAGIVAIPGTPRAQAVSEDGTVVGGTLGSSASGAYVWTASGGVTAVPFLPGYSRGFIGDLSGDGTTVVGVNTAPGLAAGPMFHWTATGGLTDLGFLPGDDQGFARGTNFDGSVVVGSTRSSGTSEEAFVWTTDGGMMSLGFLPGGDFSLATAVSADGSLIVGRARRADGTFAGVKWVNGIIEEIPSFLSATDVSDDGTRIVGRGLFKGQTKQAIWEIDAGTRAIEDVLTDLEIDYTGYRIGTVTSVSADGTTITGDSHNETLNAPASYVIRLESIPIPVPEPLLATLVATGIAGAALRRGAR